jgi:hypothetical protein
MGAMSDTAARQLPQESVKIAGWTGGSGAR